MMQELPHSQVGCHLMAYCPLLFSFFQWGVFFAAVVVLSELMGF